ncbi:hypothetical protein N8I77_010899 [Diaporthe amygdali]|uniref:Uncharacterized protein n=1 Tax=Phomopsis amygdali TaxID=1214568 RepID=A0AAD9W1I2_PHOAM|nr:hypothetical protein N8I77_010899 [Diaporthe amygdali]
MPLRHESFFEYGLTRPYPFRWFTWAAVIGCICASVLFTVLNLGTSGYSLEAVYTTNPNGTTGTAEHELWFQKPPFSWIGNLQASCQSQALMLGSNYMTTHLGFSYNLVSLSQQDSNNKTIQSPGAPYLNSTLRECEVGSIQVYPTRKDTSLTSANSWTWGDTYAAANVSCIIPGPNAPVTASFQVQYVRPSGIVRNFLSLDNRTDSSQWWGAMIIDRTWYSLAEFLGTEYVPEHDDQPAIRYDSGDFTLFHNETNASNVSSDDFFYITGKFYAEDSLVYMAVNENNWDPILVSQMNDTGLATAVDGFAKAFYSSVLLDLGSASPLTDGNSITYLLSQRNVDVLGIPSAKAVNTLKDETAPLNSTAAQLSLQYVCSVPKQKDRASMVVSIIIADLVLLSAFWQCLNWAATKWLSTQTQQWNYCPGCERNAEDWKFGPASKTDDESVQLVLQRPDESRVGNW